MIKLNKFDKCEINKKYIKVFVISIKKCEKSL